MIELGPLEERLALFAEGLAGRYFHIKPTREFTGRSLRLSADEAALAGDTLYLPERLELTDAGAYRVLVVQQLAHHLFGTYTFRMSDAESRLPALRERDVTPLVGRASDFTEFFHRHRHPALASRSFQICERLRVDVLAQQSFPGMTRHYAAHHAGLLAQRPPETVTDLASALHALECRTWGADPGLLAALDASGTVGRTVAALDDLAREPGDVYRAAATAMTLHDLLQSWAEAVPVGLALPLAEEQSDPTRWMQREARLEDWEKDLRALDSALTVEELHGREAEAADGALADGTPRPEDVNLTQTRDRRDTLARRIGMERSAVRDALGAQQGEARSYRYDEWNHLERRYLPRWCRVFEERLPAHGADDLAAMRAVMQSHRRAVQQRLEQIRPQGYQRLRGLADGDELDLDAVIRARQDIRSGTSPDERVYSRRDRVHRDVCAAFLVDLSASTDDALAPPEPRRIIDVQRESLLAMAAALERLGDSYGIYGFSGYGRDCVEFCVAKEPDERLGPGTLAAIAGMKPRRSTRMGPAIRHAVRKLLASDQALKVLLIISDGFPQDCDYGPERGDHEYGVQDTARALQEARAKGVEAFCVTVDRSGHDYLKRMCPDSRYLVIEEVEDLPEQLTKVYQALTT